MSRRRIVAIVAASVIALLIVIVVGAVMVATHTDFGRTRLRSLAAGYLARAVKELDQHLHWLEFELDRLAVDPQLQPGFIEFAPGKTPDATRSPPDPRS